VEDIKTKRILMTLMRLEIGGAETHVLELSLELARRGFQVIVASGGGVYEEHLKKAGIKHYKVPMYTKSPNKMASSLCALRRIIREEKIDIVHAHGRIPAFLCGLLHPFMNFTFVTTAHWVFKTSGLLRYLSNWGEKVMSVSEDIKTYLIDNYGTNPSDIYVTINGIDTQRFSAEADFSAALQEFSLQKDSRKIVYISRMDEDRALVAFHLVEVAREIEAICPGVEIVIVGGGNVFDALQEKAEAVNQEAGRKLVTLTGARTDIDAFCAMSDLFIGVSRSALEAMACAKPVIVAGNEGYLGIFDEDKLHTGIDTNFCCRGLEASTSELLLRDVKAVLQAEKAEQERLGAYARQVICEYYSVSKMALDCVEMYCAGVEEKRWDAVISGYYGYGNAGDEALLMAMIKQLRCQKPDIRLCVLSKDAKQTEVAYGVHAINRYHVPRIKQALRQSKLFISGGGSLLQDMTSDKSLWYYLSLIKMAQKVGTPVFLYANGIGPITKPENRKRTADILKNVAMITLRDPASKDELSALHLQSNSIEVTADPALTLQKADEQEIAKAMESLGITEESRLLGVSIRPWKHLAPDFMQMLAGVIHDACQTHGLTPFLIPMKYPEDLEFSKQLADLLPEQAIVLDKAYTPGLTMGLIGKTKVLLAMRLHSLIYAAAVGVPTVGLSYDPKVDAFMQYIGVGETVSVTGFSPDDLQNKITACVENEANIRGALAQKREELCKLAQKNAELAYDFILKAEGNYGYEADGN